MADHLPDRGTRVREQLTGLQQALAMLEKTSKKDTGDSCDVSASLPSNKIQQGISTTSGLARSDRKAGIFVLGGIRSNRL